MIEKIYVTVVLTLVLLFFGSWILMNTDEKREDTWYKTTLATLMLLILLSIGGFITSIWLN